MNSRAVRIAAAEIKKLIGFAAFEFFFVFKCHKMIE